MAEQDISAILLAGGQGSRMNHQDKAWVPFKGKALIEHAIEHIRDDVDQIIISRNREHPGYDRMPYVCQSDEISGYQGPLAGISSCLKHINSDLVLVLPCDVPRLPDELIPELQQALSGCEIAVAETIDRIQPLIFLARKSSIASVTNYLESGRRSVMGWLETQRFKPVRFEDGEGFFENINETTQLR